VQELAFRGMKKREEAGTQPTFKDEKDLRRGENGGERVITNPEKTPQGTHEGLTEKSS